MAIYLRVTGWNIKTAAAILKNRARRSSTSSTDQNDGKNDRGRARKDMSPARRRPFVRSSRHLGLCHHRPSPRHRRLPYRPAPTVSSGCFIAAVAKIHFAPASGLITLSFE
jgi:hypothetical protein